MTSHRYLLPCKLVLACFLLLVYAAYSFTARRTTSGTNSSMGMGSHSNTKSSSTNLTVGWPTRSTLEGAEYLWQRPSFSKKPRAILFVGHGCQHSMTDWWTSSTGVCPDCIGLPEELAIVHLALEKYQLVVVAMSSLDRVASKCWSSSDGPRVAKVLLQLQQDMGGTLPILAFGASSGGHFVSTILPKAIKDAGGQLAGFISQIMGAPPAVPDVPAVYITMDRDKGTDKAANRICQQQQAENVPAKHIRLAPRTVANLYFSERITTISVDQSKKMVEALQAAHMLDDATSRLTDDPRQSNWRSILSDYKGDDTMVADQSPLSEVLNVAWGMHEMSRDGVADALEFLLERGKTKC